MLLEKQTEKVSGKTIGFLSSASSSTSILGSWQICHNLCLGIIVLLGFLGIVITGMPLLFLTTIAVPVWLAAAALWAMMMALHVQQKCISRTLLMINTGLLIAGIPFASLRLLTPVFWTAGGAMIISGLILFIRERQENKGRIHEKK